MEQSTAILLASKQEQALQKIIRANFDQESLTIDLWSHQDELLKVLSQQTYALLIVDLTLLAKIIQKEQFWLKLKTISPDTDILLLAMDHERSEAIRQLQQGATDYLILPIDAIELSIKIERLLEIRALKSGSKMSLLDTAADELLTLYEAIREIGPTLQPHEALEIVLSKAHQTTRADLVKIYLADQNGKLSQNKFITRTTSAIDRPRENNLLFTLARRASFNQELISCQKTSDPEWQHQSLQSALLIPIISRDKLIGVWALGSEQPSTFSAGHVRWLSIFSAQAAIAIENARLFQDLSSAYIDLAQSREEILQSRNTLQVLFDGITDGLYILDQDLTIDAVNQVEAERQGYRPDELIGRSCLSSDWAKAAPELLNCIKESLQTGQETTWISSESETDPYLKDKEFRIYPIRNRLAQIEQVVVFAQDVSERRRWQASLFRSANLAAVGQLAGSVAHQINNPLTIIMANSQLLLLEAEPDSEPHELTTGIFKAGERIQNIIENLLGFSNQETYFFVQTDLIETIEGALALVIRSLNKAHIELVRDYQVQPVLSASVSHLKLVWMNLLLNARDAVMNYADQPKITIATRSISERMVKVTITDNGVGIAEKDFEQLFRPFFTTKPVGRALGLGLYSAHMIIEHHRGQIKAFSQPGVITTFDVILPLDNPRDL